VQAVRAQRRIQIGVTQIDHRLAVGAPAHQAVDPGRARGDRVEQPEPREHRLPGRLQRDPGADRTGLGDALEHGDGVAGAREQDRRGRACRPGADDADPQRDHRTRAVHTGIVHTA
jgi:hypothetical protein